MPELRGLAFAAPEGRKTLAHGAAVGTEWRNANSPGGAGKDSICKAIGEYGRPVFMFVPATITKLRRLDPGDLRIIELTLEDRFPENFRYHPALTREWAEDWPYTRSRVIRMEKESGRIDLSPLIDVVPDIGCRHVRVCGRNDATRQLVKGLHERKISPLSIRDVLKVRSPTFTCQLPIWCVNVGSREDFRIGASRLCLCSP